MWVPWLFGLFGDELLTGVVLDDPSSDPQARGDPFKTLFVARLSYDVKESDLEREFGRFGPIERVGVYFKLGFVFCADICRFGS